MLIKNVVLIGGGVLGSQIAYQSAYKGFNVTTYARTEASIGRAQPKLDRLHGIYIQELTDAKNGVRPVSRGLTDSPDTADYDALIKQADEAYRSFKYETNLAEAVKDADLVIEALAEDPKQKIEFYSKMKDLLPDKTIIVTNSSTLLPSMFAEYTGRPDKFLALHFANTIWKNNTAEVMGHPGTDQVYYDIVVDFAEKIGMIPLCLKKEQPGYILNSMLVPFLNSAQALLVNEVADVETIDKTWQIATGAPLGPFRILDIVGITTAYNITSMHPSANDPTTLPGKITKLLKEEYIDKGKLGINAGEGFYSYK